MRKWKKMMITTGMMLLMGLMVGCGSSKEEVKEQGKDTSLEDIQSKGKFVLGLDASFPPMGFRDETNEIVGYDIDLAREVCDRMGVELVVQPISWASNQQELDSKNIDCIWNGLGVSEERKQLMTISAPYMNSHQVLIVEADSPYQTKEDLDGKVLVTQKGSTSIISLEKEENIEFKNKLKEVVLVEDNIKALKDLQMGSDVAVMSEVLADYYLKDRKDEYRILEEYIDDGEMVIGFRKGEEALKNEVEKCLKEMVKDGTMKKIDEKWFGREVSTMKE